MQEMDQESTTTEDFDVTLYFISDLCCFGLVRTDVFVQLSIMLDPLLKTCKGIFVLSKTNVKASLTFFHKNI